MHDLTARWLHLVEQMAAVASAIVRYCRGCRQEHICDEPFSQCRCPWCSSDQIETAP